ncbi:MAG: hypothetical protein HRU38_23310 [Saccharospirillaceae bacterium]|nr:hypothetical protein [Saccharospirillaceae bacterium]
MNANKKIVALAVFSVFVAMLVNLYFINQSGKDSKIKPNFGQELAAAKFSKMIKNSNSLDNFKGQLSGQDIPYMTSGNLLVIHHFGAVLTVDFTNEKALFMLMDSKEKCKQLLEGEFDSYSKVNHACKLF